MWKHHTRPILVPKESVRDILILVIMYLAKEQIRPSYGGHFAQILKILGHFWTFRHMTLSLLDLR